MMMNLLCLRGSCPNFLRPIYHTLSASQAPKRGHAPRKKPMPATALVFMFDCYWPAFTCRGTDLLSGRYTISGSCWPFADAVRSGLHHLRVSVPEPCPVSDAFHQPLDRVLDLLQVTFLLYLSLLYHLLFFMQLFFTKNVIWKLIKFNAAKKTDSNPRTFISQQLPKN